ncbi:hypothetical protein M427DRAFT_198468 [Gonapodya prolifera JEL478]|uniref:ATPase AAA-type core domain-containing protein n=1 Tax=Gonapodya prolifera (strain JEL478) TaxID=1344416 RepID=A0A139APP8_GONPJ|nr:hypothetical protein M427DRAFT_198468 [Gonapodya prolifera JEL478]|eukprot:KXS18731.1 hypothetical protein M427DRAFT_198468 [Gonapodya prolifera JEL478]
MEATPEGSSEEPQESSKVPNSDTHESQSTKVDPEPILVPDSPHRVSVSTVDVSGSREQTKQTIELDALPDVVFAPMEAGPPSISDVSCTPPELLEALPISLDEPEQTMSTTSGPRRSTRRTFKHQPAAPTSSGMGLAVKLAPGIPAPVKSVDLTTTPDFFLTPAQRAQKVAMLEGQAREAAIQSQARRAREEVERRDAEAKRHAEAMGNRGVAVNRFFEMIKRKTEEAVESRDGERDRAIELGTLEAGWPGPGAVHIGRQEDQPVGGVWKSHHVLGPFCVASQGRVSTSQTVSMHRNFPYADLKLDAPPHQNVVSETLLVDLKTMLTRLASCYSAESLNHPACVRLLSLLVRPHPSTHEPAAELFCEKYAPNDTSEVLANADLACEVTAWLERWKVAGPAEAERRAAAAAIAAQQANKRGRRRRAPRDSDDDDFVLSDGSKGDEDLTHSLPTLSDPTTSTLLLIGPTGSCKTALVRVAATTEGYEVLEMAPNERRSRPDVLGVVGSVTTTHVVRGANGQTSESSKARKKGPLQMVWRTAEISGSNESHAGTLTKVRKSRLVIDDNDDNTEAEPKKPATAPTASAPILTEDVTSSDTFIVIDEEEYDEDGTMVEGSMNFESGPVLNVCSAPVEPLPDVSIPSNDGPNISHTDANISSGLERFTNSHKSDDEVDNSEDSDFQPVQRRTINKPIKASTDSQKRRRGRPPGSGSSTRDMERERSKKAEINNSEEKNVPMSTSKPSAENAPKNAPAQAVIAFEQADMVFREDRDFWKTIADLAAESKRPIVMMANDWSLPTRLPSSLSPFLVVRETKRPPIEELAPYLQLVALAEGKWVRPSQVGKIALESKGDIAKALASLEFECKGAPRILIQSSGDVVEDLAILKRNGQSLKRSRLQQDDADDAPNDVMNGSKRPRGNDSTQSTLTFGAPSVAVPLDGEAARSNGTPILNDLGHQGVIVDVLRRKWSHKIPTDLLDLVEYSKELFTTNSDVKPESEESSSSLCRSGQEGVTVPTKDAVLFGLPARLEPEAVDVSIDFNGPNHESSLGSIEAAVLPNSNLPASTRLSRTVGETDDSLEFNPRRIPETVEALTAYADFVDSVCSVEIVFDDAWDTFMIEEPDVIEDSQRISEIESAGSADEPRFQTMMPKPSDFDMRHQKYRQCFAGELDASGWLEELVDGVRNHLRSTLESIVQRFNVRRPLDLSIAPHSVVSSGVGYGVDEKCIGSLLFDDLDSDRLHFRFTAPYSLMQFTKLQTRIVHPTSLFLFYRPIVQGILSDEITRLQDEITRSQRVNSGDGDQKGTRSMRLITRKVYRHFGWCDQADCENIVADLTRIRCPESLERDRQHRFLDTLTRSQLY